MESLTLAFFVVALLLAALFVTQTIRRELKARAGIGDGRRHMLRARALPTAAPTRRPDAPALHQHAHRPPPR